MTFSVRKSAAWKAATFFWARKGAAWKQAQAAWVRQGGGWRKFYDIGGGPGPPDPGGPVINVPIAGDGSGGYGGGTYFFGTNPTGGSGSYSYSWSADGAITGTTGGDTSLFGVTFSPAFPGAPVSISCHVTDTAGNYGDGGITVYT